MVAGPRILAIAWLILALGIASRLVPFLERPEIRLRRWLLLSLLAYWHWYRLPRVSWWGETDSSCGASRSSLAPRRFA